MTLDLKAIKQRLAALNEGGSNRYVREQNYADFERAAPKDVRALIEEVERLRGDNTELVRLLREVLANEVDEGQSSRDGRIRAAWQHEHFALIERLRKFIQAVQP